MRRVLATCVLAAACHGSPPQKPAAAAAVQVAKVTRGTLTDRVLITGELRAAHAEELVAPRTSVTWDVVIRWMAEDGTMVKAGDRVLAFDNSAVTADLESKQLAYLEAQMTLQSARDMSAMESENKQNELEQHQIALDEAKIKAGVPADLLAKRDAQERQLDEKRAEIAVKKAKEDLEAQKLESDLENQVKAIYVDKAKRAIDDANSVIDALELRAPRDGMIVIGTHPWEDRKYRVGDSVQPGWSIITMPDPSAGMVVHAELSDVDDGRISVGMTGSCTLDAYPAEPVACTVTNLTPVARSKGEQSLRRAFSVDLSLAKSDPRLIPGMSVKVELARPGIANALLVPRGAIAFSDDGKQATDHHVRVHVPGGTRDVTLGPCDEQRCSVEQGLAEGDQVVIGGGA